MASSMLSGLGLLYVRRRSSSLLGHFWACCFWSFRCVSNVCSSVLSCFCLTIMSLRLSIALRHVFWPTLAMSLKGLFSTLFAHLLSVFSSMYIGNLIIDCSEFIKSERCVKMGCLTPRNVCVYTCTHTYTHGRH